MVNSQTCKTYKTASITGNASTGNQTYNITGDCYNKVTVNQTAAYNAGVIAEYTEETLISKAGSFTTDRDYALVFLYSTHPTGTGTATSTANGSCDDGTLLQKFVSPYRYGVVVIYRNVPKGTGCKVVNTQGTSVAYGYY